jgi:hypothetical protein
MTKFAIIEIDDDSSSGVLGVLMVSAVSCMEYILLWMVIRVFRSHITILGGSFTTFYSFR